MKFSNLMILGAALAVLNLTSCKPKDADLKAAIEQKLSADADISSPAVDVKDGVASLGGTAKDEAAKVAAEKLAGDVKGVKSVLNNLTVPAPVAAPVVQEPVKINSDELLSKGVMDATKDFPGVKCDVKDGVVSLSGHIKKTSLPRMMMAIQALHPKKVDSKLEVKE